MQVQNYRWIIVNNSKRPHLCICLFGYLFLWNGIWFQSDEYTWIACFRRNSKPYKSLPIPKRTQPKACVNLIPLDGITFNFKENLSLRKPSTSSSTSYASAVECPYHAAVDSSRESDNSLYHIPCAPKAFMDNSVHSEDSHFLCTSRDLDQISISSTASSCGYYPRRPESAGVPLYTPMSARGGYSPGSNTSKVSVSLVIK